MQVKYLHKKHFFRVTLLSKLNGTSRYLLNFDFGTYSQGKDPHSLSVKQPINILAIASCEWPVRLLVCVARVHFRKVAILLRKVALRQR